MSEDKVLEKLNAVSTAKRLANMVKFSESLDISFADSTSGAA